MAAPRVFLSSTCYDLGEVRDSLVSFIESCYFTPVLSDKGDVFYHPDLHTHLSCVNEIENCQLFILIIGGRFGGSHVINKSKSIVNAEYYAARELNIPVFTFIKREVYEDHRVYEKNKNKKAIIGEIHFPSIEKQEFASNIFEFINEIRQSPVNNGYFSFEYARDIKEAIGKQWAGLMFEFLNKRSKEKESISLNRLLDNLTLASKKSEELIENIYRHIDNVNAQQIISKIDLELESKMFFQELNRLYGFEKFKSKSAKQIAAINIDNLAWYEFLEKTDDFRYDDEKHFVDIFPKELELGINKEKRTGLVCKIVAKGIMLTGPDVDSNSKKSFEVILKSYNSFKQLSKSEKERILDSYVEKNIS